MSKIAKIKALATEGRGLNKASVEYLLWFYGSLEEENQARFESHSNKASASTLQNFANQISNWRSDVDLGHRTLEEYNQWIRMARLYKHPEILKG